MSLLAAFVAMLGKQWLNRYLRHTGGSMIERCGDRQRKFDGLEKWPFRFCMESLPIILQIALLLLTCGLSRYVWSVNTSVGRVVISFTVFGVLFYIAVVVAGTSSYECPFQTPVSIGLRYMRDSKTTRKLLASLSPLKVISLTYAIWKNTRRGLVSASHRIYATWRETRHSVVSASRHVYEIARYPSSWEISPSRIRLGIHSTATAVGHQTIILLLKIDRAVGSGKQRLVQGFRRAGLLPTTIQDTHHRPLVARNSPGLLVRVRNLESLRKQNTDNVRCVCWVLRNITDPEAIDSDIRLAGTIRWFDGDSDHDPPFDLIVSTFEECFDATKQLYPGMRDRAYFSARVILQINVRARAQSHEHASKYPIPAVSSSSVQHADSDLHHVIHMLECNLDHGKPTLDFPRGTNTHAHSLWMSNLFVDLTHVGPNPILVSYESYLSVATADHQATIANTLLMWYMFLGGCVEQETLWAIEKSYAVVLLFFSSFSLLIVGISDSLETILSHLSTRVMDVIASGNGPQHLNLLLEFLAAWEKRPVYLTPMVYQWCSAIYEAVGILGLGEVPVNPPPDLPGLECWLRSKLPPGSHCRCPSCLPHKPYPRLRPQDLVHSDSISNDGPLSGFAEREFSHVGPDCDPVRMGDASHHTCGCPQDLIPLHHMMLLPIILDIGFHLAGDHGSACHLEHTPHHEWMLKVAFSSNDDEVIADAVTVWTIGSDQTPPGSFVSYFAKCTESSRPFSPRLRQVVIHVVGPRPSLLEGSKLETVQLLNHLKVDVDDMVQRYLWMGLLLEVVCLPTGLENLSLHYWHLLDRLVLGKDFSEAPGLQSVEVMRSLEETEDWEKLEVWMVVVWQSLPYSTPTPIMEDIKRVTLKSLSQWPSALPKVEALCEQGSLHASHGNQLWLICKQPPVEQPSSESLPLLYVPVHPTQHLSILMPPFSLCQSINSHPTTHSPFFCRRRQFLKIFIIYVMS
jgi:hypothetical protein